MTSILIEKLRFLSKVDLESNATFQLPTNEYNANEIKRNLFILKSRLSQNKGWAQKMSLMKPFTKFKRTISTKFGYKKEKNPVTVAWLKQYEMATVFKLFDNPESDTIRYFDNAAFPGAFIFASHDFVKSQENLRDKKFDWKGSSLLRIKDTVIPLRDVYDIYKNYKQNFLMNDEISGDVTDTRTIDHIKNNIGEKVDVYTSDLGIEYVFSGDNESETDKTQEELHVIPNIGQILSGLLILKEKGNFVIKMYTFFEPITFSLLGLLSLLFEKLHIYKPLSSTSSNSEIYIIGTSFIGIDNPTAQIVVQKLRERLTSDNENNSILPFYKKELLLQENNQSHFKSLMNGLSQLFAINQTESLQSKYDILEQKSNDKTIKQKYDVIAIKIIQQFEGKVRLISVPNRSVYPSLLATSRKPLPDNKKKGLMFNENWTAVFDKNPNYKKYLRNKSIKDFYVKNFPKYNSIENNAFLQLSPVGLFSITTKTLQNKILTILRKLNLPSPTVTEICGGNGIDTLNLLVHGLTEEITIYEIEEEHRKIIRNNLNVYNFKESVNYHLKSEFTGSESLTSSIVFIDPPWDGPGYDKRTYTTATFKFIGQSVDQLTEMLFDNNPSIQYILWKLPSLRSFNEKMFEKVSNGNTTLLLAKKKDTDIDSNRVKATVRTSLPKMSDYSSMNKYDFLTYLKTFPSETLQLKEISILFDVKDEGERSDMGCIVGVVKNQVWVRLLDRIVSLDMIDFEYGKLLVTNREENTIVKSKIVYKKEHEIVYPDKIVLEELVSIFDKDRLIPKNVNDYATNLFYMIKDYQNKEIGEWRRGIVERTPFKLSQNKRYRNLPSVLPIVEMTKYVHEKIKTPDMYSEVISENDVEQFESALSYKDRYSSSLLSSRKFNDKQPKNTTVAKMPIFSLRKTSKFDYEPIVFLPEQTHLVLDDRHFGIEPSIPNIFKSRKIHTCHGTGTKNETIQKELVEYPDYLRARYFPPLYDLSISQNKETVLVPPQTMNIVGFFIQDTPIQRDISILEPHFSNELYRRSPTLPRNSNFYTFVNEKMPELLTSSTSIPYENFEEVYMKKMRDKLENTTFHRIDDLFHFLDQIGITVLTKTQREKVWTDLQNSIKRERAKLKSLSDKASQECTGQKDFFTVLSILHDVIRVSSSDSCISQKEINGILEESASKLDGKTVFDIGCALIKSYRRNTFLNLSYQLTPNSLHKSLRLTDDFPEDIMNEIKSKLRGLLSHSRIYFAPNEKNVFSLTELQNIIQFNAIQSNPDTHYIYSRLVNHVQNIDTYTPIDEERLKNEIILIQKQKEKIHRKVTNQDSEQVSVLPQQTLRYILQLPLEERTVLLKNFCLELGKPQNESWFWKKVPSRFLCCSHEIEIGEMTEADFISKWCVRKGKMYMCKNPKCSMILHVGTRNTQTFEEVEKDMSSVQYQPRKEVTEDMRKPAYKIIQNITSSFSSFVGMSMKSKNILEISQFCSLTKDSPKKEFLMLIDSVEQNTDYIGFYLSLASLNKVKAKELIRKMISSSHSTFKDIKSNSDFKKAFQILTEEQEKLFTIIIQIIAQIYINMIYTIPDIKLQSTSKYVSSIPLNTFIDYSSNQSNIVESVVLKFLSTKIQEMLKIKKNKSDEVNDKFVALVDKGIRTQKIKDLIQQKSENVKTTFMSNNTIERRPSHTYSIKNVLSMMDTFIHKEDLLFASQNTYNSCEPLFSVNYRNNALLECINYKIEEPLQSTVRYDFQTEFSDRNLARQSNILKLPNDFDSLLQIYINLAKKFRRDGKERIFWSLQLDDSLDKEKGFRNINPIIRNKITTRLQEKRQEKISNFTKNATLRNEHTANANLPKFIDLQVNDNSINMSFDIETFETKGEIEKNIRSSTFSEQEIRNKINETQKKVFSKRRIGSSVQDVSTIVEYELLDFVKSMDETLYEECKDREDYIEYLTEKEYQQLVVVQYPNLPETNIRTIESDTQCKHEIHILTKIIDFARHLFKLANDTINYESFIEKEPSKKQDWVRILSDYETLYFAAVYNKNQLNINSESIDVPIIDSTFIDLPLVHMKLAYEIYFYSVQKYISDICNRIPQKEMFIECIQTYFNNLIKLDERSKKDLDNFEIEIERNNHISRQIRATQMKKDGTYEVYTLFRSFGIGNIMTEEYEYGGMEDTDPLNPSVEEDTSSERVISNNDGYDVFDENSDS